MNVINFIRLPNWPIFAQLQLEEALLRTNHLNWCLFNDGSSSAIVMGISGKADQLINQHLVIQKPVPVIRRFSGGGTVFIDQNTFFATFICNSEEMGVPCFPNHVFKWTEAIYQNAFEGVDFKLLENDYIIGTKKFGGNAQYLCKNRWLHHSSLLWDFETQNMDYLTIPPKTPDYRKRRPHSEFLCRLKDHFANKIEFENRFRSIIMKNFIIQEINLKDIDKYLNLPHRKSTTLLSF